MVLRVGLTGVQATHGDQADPEVADLGQQPVQRRLVSEQAEDDRLLALAADLEAVEPGGPPAVQDTRHADLIRGRPTAGTHDSSSQRPAGAAARDPKVAWEWNLAKQRLVRRGLPGPGRMSCWRPSCMCPGHSRALCRAGVWWRRWTRGWPGAGCWCAPRRDSAKRRCWPTGPGAAAGRWRGWGWMAATATRPGSGATRWPRWTAPGQG